MVATADNTDFVKMALRVLSLDPARLDVDGLGSAVEVCGTLRGVVTSVEACFIAELSLRQGPDLAAEALRKKQRMSARKAKRRTKTAKATADNEDLKEAVAAGDISDEHADVIADAEHEHQGAVADLLPKAKSQPVDRFRNSARDWRNRKDGDDGESASARQFRKRKVASFIREEDGMGVTIAELDPVNHALFTTTLAYWVRKLFQQEQSGGQAGFDPTTADPIADSALIQRTGPQRLADALMAMAAASVNGDNASPATSRMLIIANYDHLSRSLTGRIADGTSLSPETIRRLACDCEVLPAIFNAAGQPINLGRGARIVSPGQRALLAERDGGCRGCGVSPQWCHAHHIIHWSNLGPTDLNNLVLLCPSCHHKVHEDHWRVRKAADGSFSLGTPNKPTRSPNHSDPPYSGSGAAASRRSRFEGRDGMPNKPTRSPNHSDPPCSDSGRGSRGRGPFDDPVGGSEKAKQPRIRADPGDLADLGSARTSEWSMVNGRRDPSSGNGETSGPESRSECSTSTMESEQMRCFRDGDESSNVA